MAGIFAMGIVPMIAAVAALLFLCGALHCFRKRRVIDDTPTSKTQGVFIGLVELKGSAESEAPLSSFLAGASCVNYRWRVEEHWSRTVTETHRDAKGRTQVRTRHESGWSTVAQGAAAPAFYLKDDTGAIRILPDGATIEGSPVFDQTCTPTEALYYAKGPPAAVANSDHRRRFRETAIPLHAPLYVMGHARERADVVAAEIAAAPGATWFLLSTQNEQQVRAGYSRCLWFPGILGLLAAGAAPFFGRAQSGTGRGGMPLACALTVGLYLLAAAIGWAWTVFNSLVSLRQRVRQAWAQVDIQLKRRHDLIPTLVAVVQGYQAHEASVQTAVAQLRRQLDATPPGVAGPDYAGCSGPLRAAVENYPELKADESFRQLQQNLADAEQRIALARSYFNDIATFFNTRIDSVPDNVVATLAGMRPQKLLGVADFERAPVPVHLAE